MFNAGLEKPFPGNHRPAYGFLLGCSASPFPHPKRGRHFHGSGITVNKKAENVEASRADVALRSEGAFPPIEVGRPAGKDNARAVPAEIGRAHV